MNTKATLFWVSITLTAFLLNGCKSGPVKTYYNDGQIETETKFLDDSCKLVKKYFHNGTLAGMGKICNDSMQGFWEEYYNDGSIKWKGIYENGRRIYSVVDSNCTIEFKDQSLIVDSPVYFNIRHKSIHPDDLMIFAYDATAFMNEEGNPYKFKILSNHPGNIRVDIGLTFEGRLKIVSTKYIQIN
jgi:hypothetical protein